MERATAAKTAVEERERELRRVREESGQVHVQRFFAQNKEGRWIPKFSYVSRPACLSYRTYSLLPSVVFVESRATPHRRRSRCRTGSGRRRPSRQAERVDRPGSVLVCGSEFGFGFSLALART